MVRRRFGLRVLHEEPLDFLSPEEGLFHDFGHVLGSDLHVDQFCRADGDDRPFFAESQAARDLQIDFVFQSAFGQGLAKGCQQGLRLDGPAARSAAYGDAQPLGVMLRLERLPISPQLGAGSKFVRHSSAYV